MFVVGLDARERRASSKQVQNTGLKTVGKVCVAGGENTLEVFMIYLKEPSPV